MPRRDPNKSRNTPPTRAKKSPRNSHTSARQIELQKKRAEAIDYRIQGHSYQQIGEAMGVDQSTAFRWVDEAMKAITREKAETLKKLELERLDQMQAGCYGGAVAGDGQAVRTVLAIMDKRDRLEGIDAPMSAGVRAEIGGNGKDVTAIEVTFVSPQKMNGSTNGSGNGHAPEDHEG